MARMQDDEKFSPLKAVSQVVEKVAASVKGVLLSSEHPSLHSAALPLHAVCKSLVALPHLQSRTCVMAAANRDTLDLAHHPRHMIRHASLSARIPAEAEPKVEEAAEATKEAAAPEDTKGDTPNDSGSDMDEFYSTADPRLSRQTVAMVLGLFEKWNGALASGDPAKVADLYADDGVLLPTVSNSVRSTRDGLLDYFTNFLKLQPQGVIDEYGIRQEAADDDGEACVISNSGIYTFTFGADGRTVQARYTYVYKKVGDEWKILSHHSSQLPTQLAPTPFKGAPSHPLFLAALRPLVGWRTCA